MDLLSLSLVLSILAGQLIKLPVLGNLGPTLLDFFIIVFCILGFVNLKFKLKSPNLEVKMGMGFVFVAFLSLVFTPLHLTESQYLSSFSYTLRFLLYILATWIIESGAFHKFKETLAKTLLFSGVGLALLGLLQFLSFPNLQFMSQFGWDPHYFRTVSTFLDPNFAGAYFVLTILLLSSPREENRKSPKIFLLFLLITFIALLTTFSRSSYLMFLIGGLTFSYLKRSGSQALMTIILFGILMGGFYFYTELVARPRNIDREQSASYRFSTWQQGLTIFQHNPLLGVGFNSYRYAIEQYNLSDKQFLESRGSSSNDSSLLYVLSTTGIIGFSVYLLFLISLVNLRNPLLTASIVGLLIHSIFANSLFYPFILIWMLFISAISKK